MAGTDFEDSSLLGGRPVVVGASRAVRSAPRAWMAAAHLLNGGGVLLVPTLLIGAFGIDPYPGWPLGVSLLSGVFVAVLFRWIRGMSFGFWLLRLRRAPQGAGWVLHPSSEPIQWVTAVFAIWLLLGAVGWAGAHWIFSHPYFAPPALDRVSARAVPLGDPAYWVRASFYSLGAWPARPFGLPVVHSLPYEVGPPTQFPGRVVAQWRPLEISVTFEGPKTPESLRDALGQSPSRDTLRSCFLDRRWDLECARIRRASLQRHLGEVRERLGAGVRVRVSWFQVENSQLPPAEQPSGFWIEAQGKKRVQQRFVAVTWLGTHQAWILEHHKGEHAAGAERFFREAIATLKVTDDLGSLRAWSERDLLDVQTRSLEQFPVESSEFLERVTAVQSALLSRVTVKPSDYEAYFHLGGTSSLLIRHALAHTSPELAAAAQKTLFSAWKYARDVNPKDPRGFQLERLWDELKQR